LSKFVIVIDSDRQKGLTPDQSCAQLAMCTGDDRKCSLWPQKTQLSEFSPADFTPFDPSPFNEFFTETDSIFSFITDSLTNWSTLGAVKPLGEYDAIAKYNPERIDVQKVGEPRWYHRAWFDTDKDGFSTFRQGRGYDWGGRDCNDLDPKVYPGRKTQSKYPNVDHNCNGIYGTNPKTKASYESELCSTKQFNFVALGDSATAHFSLPPCWLSGSCITHGTYQELLNIGLNEADWPQCSSITGFNRTHCPSLYTSVSKFTSVYDFARQQNPCVHRAYHNIGVNGARSTSMAPGPLNDGIITAFTPDRDNDHPYAVFLSLIGNDVCNKSTETSSMTDPEVYRKAMLDSLKYLDSVLPAGSHVWLGGLVRGSALFDAMGAENHPIGAVSYGRFYDYLNCFNTSPCAGWLNTDPNIRKRTDEHAMKLNDVLVDIVHNTKWNNFQVRYNDLFAAVESILSSFKQQGFPLSRVIEATDGFHPSTTTQSLMAQILINKILSAPENGAEIFTPNPKRQTIFDIFGLELNGYSKN
jgi:acyloxyacyl hydrolase